LFSIIGKPSAVEVSKKRKDNLSLQKFKEADSDKSPRDGEQREKKEGEEGSDGEVNKTFLNFP